MRSTAGICSPGSKTPTTIVSLEVSIPRWISPAGDVTLGMTAGSLPPYGTGAGLLAPSSFRRPATSAKCYGRSPGAGRFILTPEVVLWLGLNAWLRRDVVGD